MQNEITFQSLLWSAHAINIPKTWNTEHQFWSNAAKILYSSLFVGLCWLSTWTAHWFIDSSGNTGVSVWQAETDTCTSVVDWWMWFYSTMTLNDSVVKSLQKQRMKLIKMLAHRLFNSTSDQSPPPGNVIYPKKFWSLCSTRIQMWHLNHGSVENVFHIEVANQEGTARSLQPGSNWTWKVRQFHTPKQPGSKRVHWFGSRLPYHWATADNTSQWTFTQCQTKHILKRNNPLKNIYNSTNIV